MDREPSDAVVVAVSRRRFAIPMECPCCGAAPDAELAIPLARDARAADDSARALDFPYCIRCAAHAAAFDRAGVASAALVLVGVLATAVLAIAAREVWAIAPLAAAIPLAIVLASSRRRGAERGRGTSCATTARAVRYLGWSGTASTFRFASPTYAARFAEQNKDILEASPELRRLLDNYKRARLEVPTPAAAVAVVTTPPTAREWIATIEAARGRVARRDALRRALEAVRDPDDRRALIAATSRVELDPVLALVARASDAAAKRHVLREALAELRADNLPDALQAAELDELEAKLRDIS
jgi:hypothetical protein